MRLIQIRLILLRPQRRFAAIFALVAALSFGSIGVSSAFATPEFSGVTYSSATRDKRPPAALAGLVAQAATATTITLAWSPSRDNVAVAGYAVYKIGRAHV